MVRPVLFKSHVLFKSYVTAALVTALSLVTAHASAQTTCAPGERLVAHVMGETCVPEQLERVVAGEWTYVEFMLALGVQPVGIADVDGFNTWVEVPEDRALGEDVVDLGQRGEMSLEALTALQPDLIIDEVRSPELYAQLSAIAPTLFYQPYPAEAASQLSVMRRDFMSVAGALGQTAAGEAALASLDAKLEAGAEQLAQAGQTGAPFVLAQAFSGGSGLAEIRLFNDTALATELVAALGLTNAWQGAFEQYGFSTVGIEGLRDLGEVNFFYVVNDSDDVFASGPAAPLWQGLPFVQAGTAYPVGGDTWLFGGPLSAKRLIGEVTAAFRGTD